MHSILKSYIPVANIIAKTFGKNCEVSIHDLTQPGSLVVFVANGTVTGRKEGQSYDQLVRQVLLSKKFKDDYISNELFEADNGKKIKSSSAFIRNPEGQVVGMLCINYDLTLSYRIKEEFLGFLPELTQDEIPTKVDVPNQDVMTIIDVLIENIISNKGMDNLKRKDNIELIRFMDEKGVFLVKGAIDKVAERLGLSKVTIYSYLDEVRGKK
ncbi:MAG: transcriptional regulator [Sedimentibacter sp.]